MNYCARCMYPANAKPIIIIDETDNICSGCKYHEDKNKIEINWEEREKIFEKIAEEARKESRKRGNLYDCILPVSGGKDSHFQAYILREKYGLNALMVTFNHAFNSPSGTRNLENLAAKSGFDLLRFTANLNSVKKISRYMLETVGDLTWHYHAGIATLPFKVAVEKNIPFIMWGEEGFGELTGIFSINDIPEFKKWSRKEHSMRGYEPEDVVKKSNGIIKSEDIYPYIYPSDIEIERVGVRGIFMGNFFYWNAKQQAELMMKTWDFAPVTYKRDRTFNLFAKIDDHANDVHDYLKFLKFGYGRTTDDASTEIRLRRMTREEGIELVKQYDSTEPTNLNTYLDFMEMTKKEFYSMVEHLRDKNIWEKVNGEWKMKDCIANHEHNEFTENARLKLIDDKTFSIKNRNLYYNEKYPPIKKGDPRLDVKSISFEII